MKILVVDDEPGLLTLTENILQREGHEVVKATTGREALKICEDLGAELDLVVTDVSMPGMSGRELAKCVENLPKIIPVILMSGYRSDSPSVLGLVEEGKLDGAPFLQKPFTPQQLIETISETIKRPSGETV